MITEDTAMFGPGAYRPDPTEGITAIADLPPPEIVPSNLCGQKTQTSLFPFSYSVSPPRVSPLDFTPATSHSQLISWMMTEEDARMDWKTLLACITGSVEEQL